MRNFVNNVYAKLDMGRPLEFPIKKLVGFTNEMVARVDAYRHTETPPLSFTEAIRRLVEKALLS
jgi:hypothetical protein